MTSSYDANPKRDIPDLECLVVKDGKRWTAEITASCHPKKASAFAVTSGAVAFADQVSARKGDLIVLLSDPAFLGFSGGLMPTPEEEDPAREVLVDHVAVLTAGLGILAEREHEDRFNTEDDRAATTMLRVVWSLSETFFG